MVQSLISYIRKKDFANICDSPFQGEILFALEIVTEGLSGILVSINRSTLREPAGDVDLRSFTR